MGAGCSRSGGDSVTSLQAQHRSICEVVDKYVLDDVIKNGTMVDVEGKQPRQFDLGRARICAELCNAIYFSESIWGSTKPRPDCVRCIDELSMPLRYVLGDLLREEKVRTSRFGLLTVGDQYDMGEKDAALTIRNGLVINSDTDSEVMIVMDDTRTMAYLVFRGTSSFRDVLTDIKCLSMPDPTGGGGVVHRGFGAAWTSLHAPVVELVQKVFTSVPTLTRLFVTGHSLGGALAGAGAKAIKAMCPAVPRITVYTFGMPGVGCEVYTAEYNTAVPETYRVVNDQDLIPSLGTSFPVALYTHVGHMVFMTETCICIDPKPVVLAVRGTGHLMEKVHDHSMHNYIDLIKQFSAWSVMGSEDIKLIEKAWHAYTQPRITHGFALVESPSDFHEGTRPGVELVRQVSPNLKGACALLEANLEKNACTPTLFQMEMHRQAHWEQVRYAHFFLAVAGLLFDPRSKIREFRLQRIMAIQMFNVRDLECSGKLDIAEFLAMCKDLVGPDFNEASAIEEMRNLDINMDGGVSRQEFAIWFYLNNTSEELDSFHTFKGANKGRRQSVLQTAMTKDINAKISARMSVIKTVDHFEEAPASAPVL